jgi:hypothetical protein
MSNSSNNSNRTNRINRTNSTNITNISKSLTRMSLPGFLSQSKAFTNLIDRVWLLVWQLLLQSFAATICRQY